MPHTPTSSDSQHPLETGLLALSDASSEIMSLCSKANSSPELSYSVSPEDEFSDIEDGDEDDLDILDLRIENRLNPLKRTGFLDGAPIDLDLKACLATRITDCEAVWLGLEKFDLQFQEPCDIFVPQIFIEGVAYIDEESLYLRFDETLNLPLMNSLESQAYKNGARRSYVEMPSEEHAHLALIKSDFKFLGSNVDFDSRNLIYSFYKELDEPIVSASVDQSFVWTLMSNTAMPDFANSFGIFAKDSQGVVRGGIVMTLHKDSAIPYLYVDFLWTELQKSGLGETFIRFAEQLAKNHGVGYIKLITDGFQAPGFYKKMGYEVIKLLPKTERAKNGQYYDSYTFAKKL